jgi:hypothetical protein
VVQVRQGVHSTAGNCLTQADLSEWQPAVAVLCGISAAASVPWCWFAACGAAHGLGTVHGDFGVACPSRGSGVACCKACDKAAVKQPGLFTVLQCSLCRGQHDRLCGFHGGFWHESCVLLIVLYLVYALGGLCRAGCGGKQAGAAVRLSPCLYTEPCINAALVVPWPATPCVLQGLAADIRTGMCM